MDAKELMIKQLEIYKKQCEIHIENLEFQIIKQIQEIELIQKRIEADADALKFAKIQLNAVNKNLNDFIK